ncbi:hypothetical protein VKI21_14880 [Cyanobacterium aponinum UTEX 3222]|uniref:Uncharacterized protein n=2 Tax=Cyanobacterium aponinum TaxID=379064 RepID=A0A844H006_9CHRO|nr:hypothetical protein [Cyanobacterium aponinum]WRL41319.1 hypothetical protein VKI21_14880 [Cyanobacterium aponinum UTEX 3222]MBD2393713.1 hypothetical protein [Cyanobacterium aponinum FACHB-4101]MTF39715.1 hypothetical protein [Cyanobacterium aponinum 0216]PHV61951.1 hypothetical protein CSQ80_12955 [Cyanobacterium aponinum IPPAS B-1201]WPF89590.1 hypothetical protein SAY89_04785 [Cyanobacterium aponinum AL20115]
MNLDQQLQNLIQEAPNYGVPAVIMENGVIPIINAFAQQLGHQEYYLRQTLDNNLVLTILGSDQHPELEKKVIYAFPSVQSAAQFPDSKIDSPDIVAQQVPVSQILFQMFTMKGVDSVIFVDEPNQYQQSKEVYCDKLQSAIRQNLSNLINSATSPNRLA